MPLTKVSAGVIAANAVVDSFGTQSITGDKLGLTAINANNIVGGAVTGDKLGATSINANNIVGGTITTTQIASNTISNTNIQTGAIENYSRATGLLSGMRNRIINGAMVINQRGFSGTPANGDYTLDRWFALITQSSKFTVSQNAGSVTPPVGFTNYLGCTSSSAYSVGASDYFIMYQYIEGFNTADLGWGTANAKTVTLSFQVYSSLTGTFGGSLINNDNNRSYPFTYTVSSANTWTPVSITIAGDTTGTWVGATNGVGIKVGFGLGAGSTVSGTAGAWAGTEYRSATGATSVVGTNGATFYITGVQLEVGSTATSFDYRPYGTEFQLCQRYFYKNICGTGGDTPTPLSPMGWAYSGANVYVPVIFPQPMRATPTLSRNGCQVYNPLVGGVNLTNASLYDASNISGNIGTQSASGITTNYGYWIGPSTVATSFIAFSAEL